MENLESNEIKAESIVEQPILIFGVPLRFQNPKLTLREFSRFVACIAAALTIISCLLAYMTRRDGYVDVQIGLTLISFLIFIQHGLVYTNLISNGWGEQKGKFWCDIKIMVARGFDTIRTSLRLLITPLLFIVMSVEVGIKDPITILFLVMLAIVSEINAGTSENQNQYDMQTNEKFVDSANQLLLEELHAFQKEHALQKITWGPLIIAVIIQNVLLVALIIGGDSIGFIPFIVIFHTVLQQLMSFSHLFGVLSFVQLEIFRSFTDLGLVFISVIAITI
jgi:hypothetical protein